MRSTPSDFGEMAATLGRWQRGLLSYRRRGHLDGGAHVDSALTLTIQHGCPNCFPELMEPSR